MNYKTRVEIEKKIEDRCRIDPDSQKTNNKTHNPPISLSVSQSVNQNYIQPKSAQCP